MKKQRVDWFKVLVDLSRCGTRSLAIANRIGVSKTTVERWGQGSEPRHEDGEMLVRIWCLKTGKDRAALPMFDPFGPG